ncbi:MAG: hypothetical protein RR060_02510, partial [Victivallaceae bacterium]
MNKNELDLKALQYHAEPTPGKFGVVSTKKCATQQDLSYAYTPGVARPCLEIKDDPGKVWEYTSRGNMVAVVSDGTAVLGLGNIGPEYQNTRHNIGFRVLDAFAKASKSVFE